MSALKTIQEFFPCVPDLMSWEDWIGNFTIYYGSQNIMILPEEQWRDCARHIGSMAVFEAYPVPSPDTFESWQEWALETTLLINGPSY